MSAGDILVIAFFVFFYIDVAGSIVFHVIELSEQEK